MAKRLASSVAARLPDMFFYGGDVWDALEGRFVERCGAPPRPYCSLWPQVFEGLPHK